MPYKEPIYHFDIKQQTEEWDEMRLGKITGSQASILDVEPRKMKGGNLPYGYSLGLGKGAVTYMMEKASELITGHSTESWSGNEHTERGNDFEPIAIERYEEETFNKVKSVGFVQYSELIGCSPDGLVGDNGIIEVKSPAAKEYLLRRKNCLIMPKAVWCQIQFNLMVTGREWCDYILFNASFRKNPIWINRMKRHEPLIELFRLKAQIMELEIKEMVKGEL